MFYRHYPYCLLMFIHFIKLEPCNMTCFKDITLMIYSIFKSFPDQKLSTFTLETEKKQNNTELREVCNFGAIASSFIWILPINLQRIVFLRYRIFVFHLHTEFRTVNFNN